MWKPIIRCSLVGGVVVFLWMMFSWIVLPFHKMAIEEFPKGSDVASKIMEATPKDGVYLFPSMEQGQQNQGNTFIFLNVKRGVDFKDMTQQVVIGFITQVVVAGLITYLLLRAKAMKYWGRVRFVTIAGIIMGLYAYVPNWNWLHFSNCWTVVGFFDVLIGWFIGGLLIAKLVK